MQAVNVSVNTDHMNQSRTVVSRSSGTRRSLTWPLFTGPSDYNASSSSSSSSSTTTTTTTFSHRHFVTIAPQMIHNTK